MEERNDTDTFQLANPGGLLTSSVFSFVVTFGLFFIVIFQLGFGRGGKKRKGKHGNPDWDSLPGLEAVPGPGHWDFTGILAHITDLYPFENVFPRIQEWAKSYRDLAKFTALRQPFVLVNSAEAIQTICKSSDLGHLTKSTLVYRIMKPFINNGVLVSKGKFWQHERKILLKSQSYQSLKSYMPMLNKHCKSFVSSLEEMFKDGEAHEINELINSSFIKVISEMITGFDNDQSDEYTQYHHNFQVWKESFINRLLKPWLLLPPLWRLHPLSWKHDKAVGEMFDFAKRRIREHRQKRIDQEENPEVSQNKAVLRSVLDELVDGGVEEDQIVEEINTMMFGGHETGATAIHFFLFCMALHPEIQKECQKEVDELFEDPLSYNNETVSFEAVSSNLKLVERCIQETLRMFPPVFIIFRELQTPLKINCDGQDVVLPPKTNIVICPFTLHRNPEYYPEPEKFDPDRFLPEECTKRHAYAYAPFSAGPRNCLGLKFAMIEMKIIAAYTLRHFSITTTDKIDDIPLLPYITITAAKDYSFRFTRRNV